jgi:hypothetical protein
MTEASTTLERPPEEPASADTTTAAPEPATGEIKEAAPPEDKRWQRARDIELLIAGCDKRIDDTEDKISGLKTKLKAQEEEREEHVSELRAMIRGDEQEKLPFPDPETKASETAGAPITTPSNDDSWRRVTLEELGITKPKLIEIMKEAELGTLGAINDYTNAGKRLIDIKGVGEGAVQTIDDAMLKYWEQNPREDLPKLPEQVDGPALATVTVEDLGLAAGDIELAYHVGIRVEAAEGKKPKAQILDLQDRENRFAKGSYVVIGTCTGPGWQLQRVYLAEAWQDRVGQYEREIHKDPPGDLAGKVIVNLDSGDEMFISGEDDAFLLLK